MCLAPSASSPVKETPPESAEPQDSAEPSSSSQESLPDKRRPPARPRRLDPGGENATDSPPERYPTTGVLFTLKAWDLSSTLFLFFHPFYHFLFFCFSLHPLSFPPPFIRQHVGEHVCFVDSSPPSALQPDLLPSAVEYFLCYYYYYFLLLCPSVSVPLIHFMSLIYCQTFLVQSSRLLILILVYFTLYLILLFNHPLLEIHVYVMWNYTVTVKD